MTLLVVLMLLLLLLLLLMWLLLLMLLLAMLCLAYLLLQAVAVAQSFAHSTEDQCCRTGVPLHEYEDEEKTICEPMMPPSRSELEQLKKELRSSLSMASTSRSTLTSTSRGAQVEELLGRTDLLLLLLLQLLLLFLLLLLLLMYLLVLLQLLLERPKPYQWQQPNEKNVSRSCQKRSWTLSGPTGNPKVAAVTVVAVAGGTIALELVVAMALVSRVFV
mmetsp:Transcript_22818/g.50254  ORF Transcript_22818/g.50254 Transcript_22818/m.50254 type:complete len:218 (-) Transcript_22818:33-686(-)